MIESVLFFIYIKIAVNKMTTIFLFSIHKDIYIDSLYNCSYIDNRLFDEKYLKLIIEYDFHK